MRLISILFLLSLFLVQPLQSSAFWEHAPISEATKLVDNPSRTWESSMLIVDEVIYPTALAVPAGFHAYLAILNASSQTVYLRCTKPAYNIKLVPNSLKKVDFGILPAGNLKFHIFTPVPRELEDDHHVEPVTMQCSFETQSWPGPEFVYRAALFQYKGKFYPEKLRIPSAKLSELFVATARSKEMSDFTIGSYTFVFKAGQATMTEFKNPKGEQFIHQDRLKKIILDIR